MTKFQTFVYYGLVMEMGAFGGSMHSVLGWVLLVVCAITLGTYRVKTGN